VPADPWRDQPEVRQLLATDPRRAAIAARPASLATGTLDPRELMLELDAALPPDATVVTGVGNFTWFPVQYLRNPADRRFLSTIDFVAIGQAVPTAIGAAIGQPGRPVVAFEGDGSFMMHVPELETAARYGVPVLVFVLNDGALGAEYHKLKALGLDPGESILPSADIVELAEALGARATRITDPAQARKVVDWFDPALGPHVVDCPTSRSVVGPQ
ncbi:MAG: thiamine pyrophosphate-dependent enzyme, partial [Natronosporangium sp.]